jgi:hypothetical protein
MRISLNDLYREIKYPYDELTNLEKSRIDDFRGYHLASYDQIYIYYTTTNTLGCGYHIIVSMSKVDDINNVLDFGPTAKDITDIDNLLDNF